MALPQGRHRRQRRHQSRNQRRNLRVLPTRRAVTLRSLRPARRAPSGNARGIRRHPRCKRAENSGEHSEGNRRGAHARSAHGLANGRHACARDGEGRCSDLGHRWWGRSGGAQIVKQIGARAWVTSGSDEKLARAREIGADETINYRTTDVGKEVRARTGKRGVTVVLDNVGQASWKQSLGALGRAGRLVTCGATSGPMVETDARRLFWNQWTIMGSTMGNASGIRGGDNRAFRVAAAAGDRFGVRPRKRQRCIRAARQRAAVRQDRGARQLTESAQYTPDELTRIKDSFIASSSSDCPRCHVAMTQRPIGGGSFGLGYARRREWLICPRCHRSAIFDVSAGNAELASRLSPADTIVRSCFHRTSAESHPWATLQLP